MSRYYNRRQFLRVLLQTSGAVVAAATLPVSGFSNTTSSHSTTDVSALEQQAWKSFYRKQYGKAEQQFRQLVALQPSNPKLYTGLARVYDALNRQDQVAELYQKALSEHTHLLAFYVGYAKALQSLYLGNQKLARECAHLHHSSDNLLERAAMLYLEALKKWPDSKELQLALLDVTNNVAKKNEQAKYAKGTAVAVELNSELQQKISNATDGVSQLWRKTRVEVKTKKVAADVTLSRLQQLQHKPRRKLYFKEEEQQRDEHMALHSNRAAYAKIAEATAQKDFATVETYAQQVWSNDPNSTCAVGMLKKRYRKQRRYHDLTTLCRVHAEQNGRAWSYLALANVLVKSGEVASDSKAIAEAQEIYNALEPLADTDAPAMLPVAAKQGLASCYRVEKQYDKSRKKIAEALTKVKPESGVASSLLISYAQTYADQQHYDEAEAILLPLVEDVAIKDTLPSEVKEVLVQRRQNLPEYRRQKQERKKGRKQRGQDLSPYYALVKLQKKGGKEAAWANTLKKIEQADSKNRFAQKMRKG